jgi:protein disulfide-isomerase
MTPSSDSSVKNYRFVRSFVVAVLLIAIGAAAGFCQTPTIYGEIHPDLNPAPVVSNIPVLAEIDNSKPVDQETLRNSTSLVSVNDQAKAIGHDLSDLGKTNDRWFSLVGEAQKHAKLSNRPMMLLFTGRDWCPACVRLDAEILQSSEFANWSSKRVVKVEVNFPRGYQLPAEIAKQNAELKSRYADYLTTGYPCALFVDADGNVLAKTRYTPYGANAWIQNAEQGLQSAMSNQAVVPTSDLSIAH